MLYIIATPIGHLKDMTYRSVETLKQCDLILCEDTRHSGILLKHYDIQCRKESFHKFSERKKEDSIIKKLQEGAHIALISDAGTPCISDPGYRLVQRCIKENIQVSSLPGPTAFVLALTLAGCPSDPFQFIGFLPKRPGKLKKSLQQALYYEGVSIAYVSPYQIKKSIDILASLEKTRWLTVARELTKMHEEILRGTSEELSHYFDENKARGEFVLVIHPEKNFYMED